VEKMPGNFLEADLRVQKTLKAIQNALYKRLKLRSFSQMTVNELCEEAQISRPAFYTHFNSKYDLLKFCLSNIGEKMNVLIDKNKSYVQLEKAMNQLVHENEKVITNLIKDANVETLELLDAFMFSFLGSSVEKGEDGNPSPRYIVFSNFCAGGIMKLLSWQVENKFPQDLQWINIHFVGLITHILAWETEQNHKERGKALNDRPKR